MFCDNGENQFTPCVYLKDKEGKIKEKFIDVKTSISDDGTLKPVFTRDIDKLLDYFEEVEFGRATNPALEFLKGTQKNQINR